MTRKQYEIYKGHRIEWFYQPRSPRGLGQSAGTFLCSVKIDGEWMNVDPSTGVIEGERGTDRQELKKNMLDLAKGNIDFRHRLEGK